MRAIDRILASVDMTPVRKSITLPDGYELEFYVTPLSSMEREKAMKEAGDGPGSTSVFSQSLILQKCRDEHGQPLFTKADLVELKRTAASISDDLTVAILGSAEEEEAAPDPKSTSRRAAKRSEG